jgi:hypothetical protein
MRPPTNSSSRAPDPVLRRYEAQFRALRAQLADLWFFCKGTILHRRLTCGKPGCACAETPARRHGPYCEWTYKVAGKTVNVRLAAEEAAVYRAAAAEWRRLRTLLRRLEGLSRRALKRKGRLLRRG